MAVTDQTPIGGAVGNGVTTVFPFAYYIGDEADLVVQRDGVNATLNVDYVVSGAGNQSGGQIAFVTAPANGVKVTHFRNTSLTRTTDYQDGGDLPARTVNLDFDRLWFALQEIFSGGKGSPNALRVPAGEVVNPLPRAAERANKLVAFDSFGNPTAVIPSPGSAAELAIQLASPADIGSGDALIAVKQPFTGAVARTQHDKNIDTGLYAEDFRLAGDPDDTLSIQRVLNLGRACLLRANKTYTAHGLVAVEGAALMCPNGEAKIVVPAGAGRFGLLCEVNDFTVSGIWFSGGAEGTAWNVVAPVTTGDRDGIVVGKAFGTGAGLSNVTLRNLRLTGFDHAGFFGREVQVGMSFDKRVTLDNVSAYSCYVGLWYSPRFEYTTTTNSKGYRCYAGVIMQAGNNLLSACQFEENYENAQMAPGENDGHGTFIGCSFNHAIGLGLNVLNIVNGHVFTGCQFWYAPIQLSNCTGIRITHSQIRYSPVTVTGGGLNMVDDNWVGAGGLPRTFSGTTFTSFRRNRTTSTDNTVDEAFGDLWVSANALSIGSSFTWNATTDTAMTPAFEYLRYHGVESSFINASGRVYIPKSMRVRISVRITFATAGVAERPVVKAVRRSFGGTVMETAIQSIEAPSSRGECTLNLSAEMICNNGDSLEFTLRSLTGTGITVASGGFRLVVSSAVD